MGQITGVLSFGLEELSFNIFSLLLVIISSTMLEIASMAPQVYLAVAIFS